MNRQTTVSIIKKINVADLSGEKVMVDFNSGKYYLIKGVGNDIWDMVQESISVDEIIRKLMSEYEVTEEECERSVLEFLNLLQQSGMIVYNEL